MTHSNYRFGEFYLDTASRNLLYRGKLTRLSPRAFDILLLLMKNQGQVIKKEELIETVWAESFVEENNLPVHISALRRVLKERDTDTKHIETVSGRGYCFLTPVKEIKPGTFSQSSLNLSNEPSEIRSIAVLPFINRNDDSKSDYLAEGITDSLISKLSQISQLKVISYSAVTQYKNQQSNLQEVGFLLGVDSILTGNIIEFDEELEIRVELVRVSDLSHIWGTQYQCRLEQLFKTKTEISVAIADKLQIQLTKTEEKQLAKQPTKSSEAYQLYLKGYQLARTFSKQGLWKSIDCCNEALKLDPNFALAYAGIGYAYFYLALFFYEPTKENVSKAKAALEKAVEIDGDLSEAYATKGHLMMFEFDFHASENYFTKARECKSLNSVFYSLYAGYLMLKGNFREALNCSYKQIELNPQPNSYFALSSNLMLMDEIDKAIDNWNNLIELFSDRPPVNYGLAICYTLKGKFDEALRYAQIALKIENSTENLALYAYVLALSGNHDKARKIVKQLIDAYENNPVDLYDIAVIYNAMGETDNSFDYIEKAFESKFSHLCVLKIDPRMKSLHSDPRFEEYLQKLGLA